MMVCYISVRFTGGMFPIHTAGVGIALGLLPHDISKKFYKKFKGQIGPGKE